MIARFDFINQLSVFVTLARAGVAQLALLRPMLDTSVISAKHRLVLAVAVAALAFFGGYGYARAIEGPAHASPAIKQFKVGKLDVTVLVDAYWLVPNNGSVLGDDKTAAS